MLCAFRWLVYLLLIVGLTALTQIGGAVLVFSTLVVWSILPGAPGGRIKASIVHVLVFALFYGAASFWFAPMVARMNGRVPLPCLVSEGQPVGALTPVTCALNRHYAVPKVARGLDQLAADLQTDHPGTQLAYLDAGFPFLDFFPMLPHLSHRRGTDLDLAFFYTDSAGNYLPGRAPSPIGYFGFEQPRPGSRLPCDRAQKGLTLRWDLDWLQPHLPELLLDEPRTAAMLFWLVESGPQHGVTGLIVEPHLTVRLGVTSKLIRFQGCRAARHDDHIHVDFD